MSEKLTPAKRIYFVRHGETDANVRRIIQSPTQELNEKGLAQAARIAERSKNLEFQKIFSSDYSRALQTATIIAEANSMNVEVSPLFRERLGPSQFFDLPDSLDEFRQFLRLEQEHSDDMEWHFADEENFHNVSIRADAAWKLLEEESSTDILVVTHGLFLRFLVCKVLLGSFLTPEVWYASGGTMKMSNAGITVCIHEDGRWRLLTWNDHAHFAE